MMIESSDRLPVWHLCKSADMPRRDLLPLLAELGLTVEVDMTSGEFYASRSEFRELLQSVAAGAA